MCYSRIALACAGEAVKVIGAAAVDDAAALKKSRQIRQIVAPTEFGAELAGLLDEDAQENDERGTAHANHHIQLRWRRAARARQDRIGDRGQAR